MTEKTEKDTPQLRTVTTAPFSAGDAGSSAPISERGASDPLTSPACSIGPANCQERVIIDATPHGRLNTGEQNAVRQKRFDNFRTGSSDGFIQQICVRVEYFNDETCSEPFDDDNDPMTPEVFRNPNPHDANQFGLLQITLYDDFLGFAAADDRWQGWPEQRGRVLDALHDVDGLLWLGGDVHFATVSTVDIPGSGGPGESMWEALAGPAGRSPNVAADLYEHDGSHYQFLFSTFNTVLLTFDPGLLQVHIEYVDDDGATIAETTLAL